MPESMEAAAHVEDKHAGSPRAPHDDVVSAASPGDATRDPESGEVVRSFRVALVTMPFASLFKPSLPLGLLKAICRRAGFQVDDHYLNLPLAAELGFGIYYMIEQDTNYGFTGDWLFSATAFGEKGCSEDYLSAFPNEATRFYFLEGKDTEYVWDVRKRVIPAYIEACLNNIDWGTYGAVGFTSTFQQNIASLALARRIKEKHPHVTIIFGGANMEAPMGIEHVRAFPWIDYAVSGEGDAVLPELLTRLAEGRSADGMRGLIARCGSGVSFGGPSEPIRDLDSLPVPDFDTYYEAARRYGIDKMVGGGNRQRQYHSRSIPVESSRGCWWGQKSHCTFCGLNGTSMAYRSKSPKRFIAEMDELSKRYGNCRFTTVDMAMDLKYVTELFGPLAARDKPFELCFATKSNLTREQVRLMAAGGLSWSVPGIESLSSRILKLMRKGVTKLQNVNLLRWFTYYNINVDWKILAGFPGERPEDYADQLATCRLINHTIPPVEVSPIFLQRYSPFFDDSELFPTKWRRPAAGYRYVYPECLNLEEAAYHFEYEPTDDILSPDALVETRQFVALWCGEWESGQRPQLTYGRVDSDIVIHDSRSGSDRSVTLYGLDADVYEAFSPAPGIPAQVCDALPADRSGAHPDVASVVGACEDLCEAGLMIGEGGKYLSLALPAAPDC